MTRSEVALLTLIVLVAAIVLFAFIGVAVRHVIDDVVSNLQVAR